MVVGGPGQTVRLTWLSFHLEQSPDCSYDSVAVWDNNSVPGAGSVLVGGYLNISTTGGLVGRYCGTDLPPATTSSASRLAVVFTRSLLESPVMHYTIDPVVCSDHSVSGLGFTASYVLLDSASHCGGDYHTTTGLLTSPGYPQQYPHSR